MTCACVVDVEKSAEHPEKPVDAPAPSENNNNRHQSIKQDKAVKLEKCQKPEKPEKPPKPTELLQPPGALYGNVERDMNTEVKVADLSKYVTERTLDEGFKKEYTVSGTPLSACFYSAVQYSDRCTNLFCTMYNLF